MGLSSQLSPRLAPVGGIFDIPLGSVNEPNANPLTNTNVSYAQAMSGTVGPSGGWPIASTVVGTVSSYIFGPVAGLITSVGSLFTSGSSYANPTASANYTTATSGSLSGSYSGTDSAYTGVSSGSPTSTTPSWLWPAVIGTGALILVTSLSHHHSHRR